MATHYCPTDRVHFTWDTGNEPLLTVADGDTVVFETRDVSDNQIGPGLRHERDRGPGLGPRVPARRAGLRRGRRAGRHARGRDPRPPHQGLGLDGDPARARAAGRRLHRAVPARSSTLTRGDVHALPRGHRRSRWRRSWARWASARRARARSRSCRPGTFGGNLDTRQLVRGTTLFLPVQVEGALFSTGDAHGCQGDGEICVTGLEAPMYATMRFRVEKRLDPGAAVPHRARPADARRSTTARSSPRPASAATCTWPRRTRRGR